MEKSKACTKCGHTKPLNDFYAKSKFKPKGFGIRVRPCKPGPRLQAYCKTCTKSGATAWLRAHPQAVLISRRKRAKQNALKAKLWANANRARRCEQDQRHRAKNPGVYAAYGAARRVRKARAQPTWADPAEIKAIYALAAQQKKMTGDNVHVDHIVPLKSKLVCGLHCPDNLRLVIGGYNSRKGNHTWPDMP